MSTGVRGAGPNGELAGVMTAGRELCLAMAEGEWYAVDDLCTHEDCPLSDGFLEGTTLECGCHGAVFDVRTGAVLEGPADDPVAVYPTRVDSEFVEVWIP